MNILYEDVSKYFSLTKVDVLISSAGPLNAALIGDIEPVLW